MKWAQLHIGDLIKSGEAEIQTGPFGTQLKASDYTPEGTPVINVRNIGYSDLRLDSLEYVPDRIKDRLKQHILAKDDIVFGRKGAVDRHAIISEEQSGWVQGSDCIRLRLSTQRLNSHYLSYALLSETHKKWMLIQGSNKATMASLNHDVISRIPFALPPLPVQDKIIGVLGQFKNLIENNRRRIALLEQAARLLYEEWFVRFRVTVPMREVQPEQWRRRFISEIVTTQYGYTDSASVEPIGPKFLRGTDINKTSYIDWDSVPYCSDRTLDFEQYALKPNDILVIRMADPGKVAIVEREIRAVFASYLVRLQILPDAEVRPLYLFYVMASPAYSDYITGSSEKSTRKSASAPLLTNFEIRIPPLELQQKFVDTVGTWRKEINLLLQQNGLLAKARDLLLPRLMNGEVKV